MKIKYEKPVAIFDEFAANQFIASCEQIITDNKAGMNCVNPDHYDLPWNKKHLKYSSSESNKYHTKNGATPAGARVENVFTTRQFGCGTLIPAGSTFSSSSDPSRGMVYPFNGNGEMNINIAKKYNYCFGAYVNTKSGSTTTQPFSA